MNSEYWKKPPLPLDFFRLLAARKLIGSARQFQLGLSPPLHGIHMYYVHFNIHGLVMKKGGG